MSNASQMILRLEDWCYRESYWPLLLQDSALFEGLLALVGQNRIPQNLLGWVAESQQDFPQNPKRYQVACALIRCAYLAERLTKTLKSQTQPFSEIDEALNALKGTPDECIPPGQEDWVRGCIYSFLTPWQWPRQVDMLVAAVDGQTGKGFIGALKLEVSPHAVGLSHYPGDTLTTGFDGFDDRFIQSLHHAWQVANTLALAGQTDGELSWRGRWRFLGPDGQPRLVNGASASGAAAVGWYHALTNTKPDPGVIVLAGIEATGELVEVDGISAKVAAIVAENERRRSAEINKLGSTKVQLLDTLAVVGTLNQAAAEKALQQYDECDLCRVVLIL